MKKNKVFLNTKTIDKLQSKVMPYILNLNYTRYNEKMLSEGLSGDAHLGEFTIHDGEHMRGIVDDGSVKYIFNSRGYRCDEFTAIHEKKHILFMGCSETVGIGGNLDEAWPYIVYKELNKNNELDGYFNIAISGDSILRQISSYFKYEMEFGKPDMVLFLIPDSFRGYFVIDELKYEKIIEHGCALWSESMVSEETYLQFLINAMTYIKIFENYCGISKINLIWGSHHGPEARILSSQNFNNYIELNHQDWDGENLYKNFPQFRVYNSISKDLHKRDMHNGVMKHKFWAHKFLEKINEK